MEVKGLRTEYKENPLGIGTGQPRLSWKLVSNKRNVRQTAFEILVAYAKENLTLKEDLAWNSGKVISEQSIHVEYQGSELQSGQRVYWKVRVWDNHGNMVESNEDSYWEMGLLHKEDWQAYWVTQPWPNELEKSSPCPYFRKIFDINKPIKRARIYSSALGLYEIELNSRKVGREVFTPGWTNYHKRLQYQVYDVTDQIVVGGNVVGAILGDGWYRGHYGWWANNRNTYGEKLALLLQLELVYEDGSKELILTDESWKASTGPILKSDIYNGETYDARLEHNGWSSVGFDESDWQKVKILKHPKDMLAESIGEKVKKIMKLSTASLTTTPKGEKVFDLGQNMVGWIRLKVSGKAGDKVSIKFAEVLDQEGNFYVDNLRGIECTENYILHGNGEEIYEPRFTFHGFRYVMVQGYPGKLTLDSITGIVVHSDMALIGSFECSEPLINQLQSNIQWGQRGNFLDVPTDCPQRDERLGWTGDAQVFAPTASFNFNTAPFFTKWLRDLATEQKEDGSVPWVVPNIIVDGGGTGWSDGFGATGWADAAVIIPWTLYESYGDRRIIEEQYDSMKAWIEYMRNHAGGKYIFNYGFHFGDWLSFAEYHSYKYNAPDFGFAGAHTDKELISTAYFYYSTKLMEKSARLIGASAYADELKDLLPKIKQAWNQEFMTSAGRLVSSTQTAYAIGLVFEIVDDEMREVIISRLAEDVSSFGHLTTGFLGTPLINYALSDSGRLDLAYMLLNNKRYPSWLFPVTMGATTIWERWDGIKPDGSLQSVGMNSFNHYAYGAIGEWLYSRVAGISVDSKNPGYKNIIFSPNPGGGLTYAIASLETMYGPTCAKWQVQGDQIIYEIDIPANCSGEVILKNACNIRLEGNQLDDAAKILLGSGKYTFHFSTQAFTVF
jgi:alpha-L-rhamnosidase